MSSTAIVAGAGPGVSGSLARLLADHGHDVGLLGADREAVEALAAEVEGRGVRVAAAVTDLTDTGATTAALRAQVAELGGALDLLHFNPSAYREADPLALTVPELLDDVALGVGALLTVVQAGHPSLRRGSRITVTGSMAADEPWHGAASLGVQKAGVRNLVASLDATLAESGVRAVSVTVRGTLSREATSPFHPDRVAEALLAAARQPEETWRTEVPYAG